MLWFGHHRFKAMLHYWDFRHLYNVYLIVKFNFISSHISGCFSVNFYFIFFQIWAPSGRGSLYICAHRGWSRRCPFGERVDVHGCTAVRRVCCVCGFPVWMGYLYVMIPGTPFGAFRFAIYLTGPGEICLQCYLANFQTHTKKIYLQHFLWNYLS